jgi:hypothetical protein
MGSSGSLSYLNCYDAAFGYEIWSVCDVALTQPMIIDDEVFVQSSDGTSILCHNKETGELQWTHEFDHQINDKAVADVNGGAMLFLSFVSNGGLQAIPLGKPLPPTLEVDTTEGMVGRSYSYSATTSDPEGDDIYYFFDWGDGNDSKWISAASAETVTEPYSWAESGDYIVRVKAKDTNGYESEWSEPILMHINHLRVSIGKGLGVTVTITNEGAFSKNVDWKIEVIGGSIPAFHTNRVFEDEDVHLTPDEATPISTGPFLCLGRVTIKVEVSCAGEPLIVEETDGFVLFFYVM